MHQIVTPWPLVTAAILLVSEAGLAADPPSLRDPAKKIVSPEIIRSVLEAKGIKTDELEFKDHTCVINTIDCNSTRNSTLTAHDCELTDGTFIDFWEFQGTTESTATINMTSSQFDTFLFLLDPTPEVVATDDDGGSGTNSRIVFDLNVSGTWAIGANGFSPADLGNYTLSLNCSGTSQPPAAPSNLTATPLSTTEIQLEWQDNSNNETQFRVEVRETGGNYQDIGSVSANIEGVVVQGLQPNTTYDSRVRARNAAGNSGYSNQASATTLPIPDGICEPSDTVLCLNNDRFKVEISWETADNNGVGRVAPGGTDDSSNLWFFSPNNWELLIKVLNGCDINNRYWVFFAATTDVGFTVTVTDTDQGQVKRYTNALGQPANAVTDTGAFSTCP